MKVKFGFGLLAIGILAGCEPTEVADPVDIQAVQYDPAPIVIKRLTADQYRNTIHTIFGDSVVVSNNIEPDLSVDGLISVGAAETTISPWGIERYEAVAYDIATQIMNDTGLRSAVVPCTPTGAVDEACRRAFVSSVGRLLWRRSLTDDEVNTLQDLAGDASMALDDFYGGLAYALAAMLQSPDFLYRIEQGETAGQNLRYTDVEMASRLSFFLWDEAPDAALLDAADAGELTQLDGLEAQVDRLLQDDKAKRGLRTFFTDYFRLYKLDNLTKDAQEFEHYSDQMGPAAREETLRFIEYMVFAQEASYPAFYVTNTTFVDRRLAAIYGVPASRLEGFGQVYLPADGPRAGLLGQASLLSLYSHPRHSSATQRGRFIRETLLCGEIPPPPSDVDTSIPEPSPDAPTLRDRIKVHLEVEVCAACHKNMDPLGLGLENFNAIGQYRRTEAGAEIDASGDLDGAQFEDARTLNQRIANSQDLPECLVRNMYRYATGSIEGRGQRPMLRTLRDSFAYHEYQLLALMKDVAMSPGFREATAPREELTDSEEGGE